MYADAERATEAFSLSQMIACVGSAACWNRQNRCATTTLEAVHIRAESIIQFWFDLWFKTLEEGGQHRMAGPHSMTFMKALRRLLWPARASRRGSMWRQCPRRSAAGPRASRCFRWVATRSTRRSDRHQARRNSLFRPDSPSANTSTPASRNNLIFWVEAAGMPQGWGFQCRVPDLP